MLGQAFWRNKAIKQQMGCSRPIGFQPCNSLWFRANFGLQLSMELHSPRNSPSLSLSLSTEYNFLKKSLRSTFSFYSLLRSTFPSNSLSLRSTSSSKVRQSTSFSNTHTLSLFTEYISLQLSPTEYVSLQLFTEYIFLSLSLSLRSTFPSNSLYGVRLPPTLSTDYIRSIFPSNSPSTDYIFLQLSTE
jgi:hypothetical protein